MVLASALAPCHRPARLAVVGVVSFGGGGGGGLGGGGGGRSFPVFGRVMRGRSYFSNRWFFGLAAAAV